MRILFTLTPAFNPNAGGVQRTTFKLGKHFTEQGLEVAYYSLSHDKHVQVEFGQLHHANEKGGGKNPENIANLKRLLKDWKPDIVINQMPYEKELTQVLTANKNGAYILLGCLRNSLFNFKSNVRDRMEQMLPGALFKILDNPLGVAAIRWRHWFSHRAELKTIIDKHDYFVLLAPPNKQELEHFVGNYKPEKILAIPNSIPGIYSGDAKKEKIILHVGRLNIQQKRSDLLLDFWEKACKQLPDWTFVIVGDGPYLSELELDLKKRNLPRIQLEGYKKPEPYYEKAPVFMMPSAYEGFPNTIIEAQSFGCVPLAFNSYAALSWIVNDKQDALLSPPYNTDDMAQQVVDLITKEGKLTTMQQAALANAGRFTIEKVGDQWITLFNQLTKRH